MLSVAAAMSDCSALACASPAACAGAVTKHSAPPRFQVAACCTHLPSDAAIGWNSYLCITPRRLPPVHLCMA